MIVGIGTDMADIRRIEDVYSRHGDRFVRRVLNVQERQRWAEHHNPVAYLAKRYAVKEAAAKALGVGIGARAKLHDFTVSYTPVGAPQLNLSGQAKQTERRYQAEPDQRQPERARESPRDFDRAVIPDFARVDEEAEFAQLELEPSLRVAADLRESP